MLAILFMILLFIFIFTNVQNNPIPHNKTNTEFRARKLDGLAIKNPSDKLIHHNIITVNIITKYDVKLNIIVFFILFNHLHP